MKNYSGNMRIVPGPELPFNRGLRCCSRNPLCGHSLRLQNRAGGELGVCGTKSVYAAVAQTTVICAHDLDRAIAVDYGLRADRGNFF